MKVVFAIILVFSTSAFSQQDLGGVTGSVTDPMGDLVINAKVILTDSDGTIRTTFTDGAGKYSFLNLPEGNYSLIVSKTGFIVYNEEKVTVDKSIETSIVISLEIQPTEENVIISDDSRKPTVSNSGIVLKDDDLDILPEDPDQLEAALKALAGNTGGPDGGAIYVDGFITNDIPPKDSIAEVRIGNNSFSAEHEIIGNGSIHISTKIGVRRLSGAIHFSFNNEKLNARNPFALERAPFMFRGYGGTISSSFLNKKGSYFLNISRNDTNDRAIINAKVVDPNYRVVPLRETFLVPTRWLFLNFNTDFQLNEKNTLRISYGLNTNTRKNSGIGTLTLSSAAKDISSISNTIRVAQTSIVNTSLINEFRLQFQGQSNEATGIDTNPRIITDTFTSGNSILGTSKQSRKNLNIDNILTFQAGKHVIRTGLNARLLSVDEYTPTNFLGTFTYSGGIAPALQNGNLVIGDNGQIVQETISGIERYRRTLQLEHDGYSLAEIRLRGGGASQYSISTGNPSIHSDQKEFGVFFQDEWRIVQNFEIGAGVRIDSQTNLNKSADVAPRISIAWAPFDERKLSTVIRGGIGWYYRRVPLSLSIQSERLGDKGVRSYLTSNPETIDSLDSRGLSESLLNSPQSQLDVVLDPEIRSSYAFQSTTSLEQQLPYNWKIVATFSHFAIRGVLRSRNISILAPLQLERIYQYESSGIFDSNQLNISVSKRFSKHFLFARYWLGYSNSDTDGAGSFPANQMDLSEEYGRYISDIRHRMSINSSFTLPFNILITPRIYIDSGRPFNIVLGQDLNQDSLFTDRPAFAEVGLDGIQTPYGFFNINPNSYTRIIPRNYGVGPPTFNVDLGISKTFALTQNKNAKRKYRLNFRMQIRNLLNHTNAAPPVGNLSSPLFGMSVSDNSQGVFSGARTITFYSRLSF